MDDETTARLHALAAEYVQLVKLMRGGQYANNDEWQRLSSDRTLVHNELLRLTDQDRSFDMYHYCRDLLSQHAPGPYIQPTRSFRAAFSYCGTTA